MNLKLYLSEIDGDSQWDFEEDMYSSDEEPEVNHLSLGPVIDKLEKLTHLSVQYRVRNAGLDFEWNDFIMTGKDCAFLAKAVNAHRSLKVLELTKYVAHN